jgi:DNA-binding MarR family transcriptional regulator
MTESLQFIQTLRAWTDLIMARSMKGLGHYLRARGSSIPQFFLLMHVRQHGQCGISDLSDGMEISNAAASQQVDKLFQLGLITRAEDPNDRRAKQITLSAKGQELLEAGINERYRWMEELSATLSEVERAKVSVALEILNDAARKLETNHKPTSKSL